MRWLRNTFQIKEQNKTPEEELSEVEIGNLPKKEFRVMIVKMIKQLERRMDAQSEKLDVLFIYFFNKFIYFYLFIFGCVGSSGSPAQGSCNGEDEPKFSRWEVTFKERVSTQTWFLLK